MTRRIIDMNWLANQHIFVWRSLLPKLTIITPCCGIFLRISRLLQHTNICLWRMYEVRTYLSHILGLCPKYSRSTHVLWSTLIVHGRRHSFELILEAMSINTIFWLNVWNIWGVSEVYNMRFSMYLKVLHKGFSWICGGTLRCHQ
jgi:hypothetical protein